MKTKIRTYENPQASRGDFKEGGIAVGNVCDLAVPGPSRCLLSGVVHCLVTGIGHCVHLYETGEYIGCFDGLCLLNLSVCLVLPPIDSYFKRLFIFTPAEKSKGKSLF